MSFLDLSPNLSFSFGLDISSAEVKRVLRLSCILLFAMIYAQLSMSRCEILLFDEVF